MHETQWVARAATAWTMLTALGAGASQAQYASVWTGTNQRLWPPAAGAPFVQVVAAASGEMLALGADGKVWESGGFVPPDLPSMTRVAIGGDYDQGSHSLAIDSIGRVWAWGSSCCGATTVPQGLLAQEVAAGSRFSVALDLAGSIHCWGDGSFGACNPPPGTFTQISARGYHALAVASNGTVQAWGADWYGQCGVPPLPQPVEVVRAGRLHSMALTTKGEVVCWGANFAGESSVPNFPAPVVDIQAGNSVSLALLQDGRVQRWGYPYPDLDDPWPTATKIKSLAVGGDDLAYAAVVDSLGSCVDFPAIPGFTQFFAPLQTQSVPNAGVVQSFLFTNLPFPSGTTFARAFIRASADLGLADERLFIRIDSGNWRPVDDFWQPGETDCGDPASCGGGAGVSFDDLVDRQVLVEVLPSPSVSAAACPQGFIQVGLLIQSSEAAQDCNGNRRHDYCDIAEGLLADCNANNWADSCEIEQVYGLDCDGNGVIDCCDFRSGAADCDENGKLDRCEIAQDPALDCDGNGRLNICEIVYYGAADFDRNLTPDPCDIARTPARDCNGNGVLDLQELAVEGNDIDQNYIIDGCYVPSPDLTGNGIVSSADLAVLLDSWSSADARADLNGDGVVNGADAAVLLSSWGPIGFCGDGNPNPGENCCNCPQDVQCGTGFDCYYGECVPCPGGRCPPTEDDCRVLYGFPTMNYGFTTPCQSSQFPREYDCTISYSASNTRFHGFSPSVISPELSRPTVAFASFGLLTLLIVPGRLLHRAMPRIRG